jgi:hypothetical protein
MDFIFFSHFQSVGPSRFSKTSRLGTESWVLDKFGARLTACVLKERTSRFQLEASGMTARARIDFTFQAYYAEVQSQFVGRCWKDLSRPKRNSTPVQYLRWHSRFASAVSLVHPSRPLLLVVIFSDLLRTICKYFLVSRSILQNCEYSSYLVVCEWEKSNR